eukprot:CAMPEP_0181439468 /NCGR_PEP_ID=MMETSP1110-20121109/22443_1 /TAXON_ID=174948 /ORGANISM="Symbiodinium sp., Strain CCMP421" /LENGTH=38 /DNA_ID= /DNA_START= /DNA_END= /DNA_ORIENTATION=
MASAVGSLEKQDLFNRIDANNDGVVSREEFEKAMQMQA